MPEVTTSITIERSPDDVWNVVRDVGGLDQWMPMVETCEFDGESRRMELAGGLGTLVEKILGIDDDARTLRYTITEAPFTPEKYLATWTVEDEGGAAKVSWTMDLEPADLADLMKGTAEASLAALKAHLEG